jgi:type II secretory pathway pseudopilin PulG
MIGAGEIRLARSRRGRRAGMTLLEVGIALVIATSAAVAVVQLVSVASQQRRIGRQRQIAQMEVSNQAERLALLAWHELSSDQLSTWTPSDLLTKEVPNASCKIVVTEFPASPPMRQIELSLSWTTSSGQSPTPVRLTFWKFHREQ